MSNEPGRELSSDLKYWTVLEGKPLASNDKYQVLTSENERGKRKALTSAWWVRPNDVSVYVLTVSALALGGTAFWLWGRSELDFDAVFGGGGGGKSTSDSSAGR
jgi:hypothetical protein